MKLGLAERHQPRPPLILLLGDGALTSQIQDDLEELGLKSILLADLPLSAEQRILPKITDIDAKMQFDAIFKSFCSLEQGSIYEHAWVHPGCTVWAERTELEGWARQFGIAAMVSPSKALHYFWHTHQLMQVAHEQGVPTLVIYDNPIASIREIKAAIDELFQKKMATFPFVLKSAYRVRGGYAQRVVRNIEELHEWVPIWMDHLQEHSGASLLFIERYLEGARYYVQPFARMKDGDIEFFPIIDATLMLDGRNWVEVCPAQTMDSPIQGKIEENSKKILEACDFVGVGNLVFLSNGVEVYLTEGLARPNFAFRLWERVARTKALAWQLHALVPGLLTERPKPRSKLKQSAPICGIDLKFYSEDTSLKIPYPGHIHEVSSNRNFKSGNYDGHLIWDVFPGQDLEWRSSGSVGALTVFARSWQEVLLAARSILKDIWISGGIQTNERFLYELLSHPWVEESMFYMGFVDEEFIPKQIPDTEWLQIMANILPEVGMPLKENESWLWMNHRLPAPNGEITWQQQLFFEHGRRAGVKGFFQTASGQTERICVFPVHESRYMIRIQNWFFPIRRSEKGRPIQLMALTSGRIHSIFFKEGSVVQPKQCVLIIESQQALISHRLPIAVKIHSLNVRAEDEVVIGQELAQLEKI